MSTFDCGTTNAECGTLVDNCGDSHDVVAECAEIGGCGVLGSCHEPNNSCEACTPYADCAAALDALDADCHPETPNGCGGVMDCSACDPYVSNPGGVIGDGTRACIYDTDEDDYGCAIACADDGDCPVWMDYGCYSNTQYNVGGWGCDDDGACFGIGGIADCVNDIGQLTSCSGDGVCAP